MKRFACMMLTALLFCSAVNAAETPAVSAKSYVLMDADSGRVLCGENIDEPRLIASITKLMTALVALESGHALDEVVTIRQEWTGIEGSSLYLKPGEQVRLETLLYGLLLRSGNDAAQAIAGFCAESIDCFVSLMNQKASMLGMKNTSFANPSGLNAENHYSSAYDMALLARACLENETLKKIVATKDITLENRLFSNHNKLLRQYEGCIGLKTGYTEKAGRTLVSAAQRNGITLICVTLCDPNDWADHSALFDYGFSKYEQCVFVRAGELICTVPMQGSLIPLCQIRAEEDISAVLESGGTPAIEFKLTENNFTAPMPKGKRVGSLVLCSNGEPIKEVELSLTHAIPQNTPEENHIFGFWGR